MATLKLTSDNKDFSFVIKKNPSSGMIAKSIRKGTAFGWYSEENTYCVAFFDGMDELSFAKKRNEEFAFIDRTRYNAPLFISVAIREFFQTALKNSDNEKDTLSKNFIEVSSVEIERFPLFQKIISCFNGFKVEALPLKQEENYDNYSLKISTENKTIYELLNFAYLLGYLIAICSKVEFQTEQSIIKRLVDASNLLNAPYYVKYLIKARCIHSFEDFKKVKDALNFSTENKLDFCPDTNTNARFNWIKNKIYRDIDILDFGCGEGRFFPLSKNIASSTYYAVDKDERARDAAKKSVVRREYDNIIILQNLSEFLQMETGRDFLVIMSEVFEHNELEKIEKILQKIMENQNCNEILLTTPNKDFNKFYFLGENELRHDDHIFEMTQNEVKNYFESLTKNTNFQCKFYELGDKVDNVCAIIGVTLTRKSGETQFTEAS